MEKANSTDIEEIMEIIEATIEGMKAENNTQWDANYPIAEDFEMDIENGTLYVKKVNGEIAGFICVDRNEPEEYQAIDWTSSKACLVIHRMAVNPVYRRQGIGGELIQFASILANQQGVSYIKTDTYSINIGMNALFKKQGYKYVGKMHAFGREKPFFCYEKQVTD